MGFRFRKSIQLFPGVRLNISKSGTSYTIGPRRGGSINIGKRGTYVNASIPGTGISYRERLDRPSIGPQANPQSGAPSVRPRSNGFAVIIVVVLFLACVGALSK
jgi:hypothetical protein